MVSMPWRARCKVRCIAPSGTPSRRAALISRLRAAFSETSKHSSSVPEQLIQALIIALRRRFNTFEPATSAATFISSDVFQSMKASISGWSISTITILAARRVVPPDLMAPAEVSPTFKKLINPDEAPPPERGSPAPRNPEKLDPVPDPYLKRRASRVHKSIMPPWPTRSSLADCMKQA